jgi:hypothetical protein
MHGHQLFDADALSFLRAITMLAMLAQQTLLTLVPRHCSQPH